MGKHSTDAEDLVWHYTDAAGLHGIVSTHLLRATSASHLNDAAELREGWERLRKAVQDQSDDFDEAAVKRVDELIGTLEELRKGADSTFSISASKNGDNLSLWRYYGGRASYAIGLDKHVALAPYTTPEQLRPHALPEPEQDYIDEEPVHQEHAHAYSFGNEQWDPVVYDPNDKYIRRQARELLQESKKNPKISLTNIFFATYKWFTYGGHKHATFSAEEEVRQMFTITPQAGFAHYRPTPSGLVRFVEVAADSDEAPIVRTGLNYEGDLSFSQCLLRHGKLPIRAIRLGPIGHRESAVATLKDFLKLHGYEDVHVSKSESPFIG